MYTSDNSIKVNVPSYSTEKEETAHFGENERTGIVSLILLFWFIRIFKPEWIISFYIPSLKVLKPIPTALLLLFFLYMVVTFKKVRFDKPMLFFAVVTLISTLFSSNFGFSTKILRWVFETLFIYSFAATFITSEKSIKKLFVIYIASLIIFSVWGIVGGGKVQAFLPLDDEDSFGPFMAIGVSLSYFIMLSDESRFLKSLCFVSFFLCLAGAVASFARGTFLSLVLLFGYIFWRSENKVKFIVRSIAVALVCFVLALAMFSDFFVRYKAEVSTIWEQGREENTANDRLYLWSRAWKMFVDNPVLGVGPGCYGFKIPLYITREEAAQWGVRFQMYGRAIHNIYFELLSEMGSLGIAAFLSLLYAFWKRNRAVKRISRIIASERENGNVEKSVKNAPYYALALEGSMIAFLANSLFFNLLFYSWFWDIMILNTLLYQRIKNIEADIAR